MCLKSIRAHFIFGHLWLLQKSFWAKKIVSDINRYCVLTPSQARTSFNFFSLGDYLKTVNRVNTVPPATIHYVHTVFTTLVSITYVSHWTHLHFCGSEMNHNTLGFVLMRTKHKETLPHLPLIFIFLLKPLSCHENLVLAHWALLSSLPVTTT